MATSTAIVLVQADRRFLGDLGERLADLEGVVAERFEVVANLLDLDRGQRIRLRTQVPESDATLPTLFDVHPGTEAMEREVFDMYGITFTDHPDMTRILMPEDWEGHPLRKDYPLGGEPVRFSDED